MTLDKGEYTVVCSFVGFETQTVPIDLTNNMDLDFVLKDYQFSLSVTVISDRAKERETPVAFTNVDKRDMELQLGSQDIPMALNTTPSVYATMQGGGAGDARVNVRGFDQRNIAIMINGVPVNDMEWGWVYWSNWDGVGDATSSLQIQRGLSAVNLSTISIGGTMNIITDPAQQKFGIRAKQEFGNDGFLKSTIAANTGLIDNKFAFSVLGVRKTGDGVIDGTWTDAWAYYFGASWNASETNRFELYAIGAPQRHGQNSYMQNLGAYDHNFAASLTSETEEGVVIYDYDQAAFTKYKEAGRKFNENYNTVNPSYTGQQFWDGSTHERFDPNFINERENYYHKPQINLNWFSQFSDVFSLYTTAYYSGGVGGGSGTFGSMVWDYSGPSRIVDWDGTIARNKASTTGSRGILRNSVNKQWTVGAISRAYIKASRYLKLSFGGDWRTAEIFHFREVRDLLGGTYYTFTGNEFDNASQYNKKLGDKIDYDFTNTVDWIGGYGQFEYTKDQLTFYGMGGYSVTKYGYTNNFVKDTTTGGKIKTETDYLGGFQVKGGASIRATQNVDLFVNAGYVSKAPIFDNSINDRTGYVSPDAENEKFTSFEAGINTRAFDGRLNFKINGYYTTWIDRTNTIGIINQDGSEGLVFVTGMDQRHMGLELEGAYQPWSFFRFDVAASFGNWEYTNDVSGFYKDYTTGGAADESYNFYVEGLKVGDSPQTQVVVAASIFPTKGMQAQLVMKHYDNYYANWDPFSRTDPNDRVQPWLVPSADVFDLHVLYDLPFNLSGVKFQLFAHVFNLFDTIYIQDAVDNSAYNGWDFDHDADDAEVFLGLPQTFNVGIVVEY